MEEQKSGVGRSADGLWKTKHRWPDLPWLKKFQKKARQLCPSGIWDKNIRKVALQDALSLHQTGHILLYLLCRLGRYLRRQARPLRYN